MQAARIAPTATSSHLHTSGPQAQAAPVDLVLAARAASPPSGRGTADTTGGAAANVLEETLVPFMETTSQCLQNYEQQMAGMQVY